jgi:hypothetical protein
MEPFRQTLSAYLDAKRAELQSQPMAAPKKATMTTIAEEETGTSTSTGTAAAAGTGTGLNLDYSTSKTLRTIKDFVVEREKKRKRKTVNDVKDIVL